MQPIYNLLHAEIDPKGWMYQPIGRYDPSKHPDELVCELVLNQTLHGAGSAPFSVSLYYAKQFESADGRDVHNAPGVTQIGQTHTHPLWAEWSAATGKQAPKLLRKPGTDNFSHPTLEMIRQRLLRPSPMRP